MKDFNKISKGFFAVNRKAGFFRMLFIVLCFLILWSFLAIFFSVIKPMGFFALSIYPKIETSNLAISILGDILKAYFSIGALASLLLILLFFWLSTNPVLNFFNVLFPEFPVKTIKQHLFFQAFSLGAVPEFPLSTNYTSCQRSELNKIFPNGPMKIKIDPGFSLILKNNEKYSGISNFESRKPLDVLLGHDDEFILGMKNISKTLKVTIPDPKLLFSNSPFINILVTYSYPYLPQIELNNDRKMTNFVIGLNAKKLEPIVETIISMGTFQSFNDYNTLKMSMQSTQSESHPLQSKEKVVGNQQFYAIRFLGISFKQINIKRNRKIPMYPYYRAIKQTDTNIDNRATIATNMQTLASLINSNVRQHMLYLIGSNLINLTIISIGDFIFK